MFDMAVSISAMGSERIRRTVNLRIMHGSILGVSSEDRKYVEIRGLVFRASS